MGQLSSTTVPISVNTRRVSRRLGRSCSRKSILPCTYLICLVLRDSLSYEGLIYKSLELLAECYLSRGCNLYHKNPNKVLGGINPE